MVKIAAVQMCAGPSPEDNLSRMKECIFKAALTCPDLDVIIFPEYCYFVPNGPAEALKTAVTVPGPFTDSLADYAVKYNVNVISGSFPEKAENGKVYNSMVFIDRSGKILEKYRKIHLMVGMGFDESESVEYGDHLSVFDTDFGRVGMMVCYDMRFPELARSMVLKGADVIFVASCFPSGTPLPPRTDHWDILTQSTALLNLTYTVACNQYGHVIHDYPFGRTRIVDPWGIVVSQASGTEEIIYGTLDLEYQKARRESIRSLTNRRPEIYENF
ncbi:MAG: carbon-nitrogen hydrolase family protein [Oscillospiraceae bacterium]